MKRYLLALLIILWAGHSFGFTSAIQAVVSAGGGAESCTSPATGTVILGSNDTGSGSTADTNATSALYWTSGYTASWSETCETTTLGSIDIYMANQAGGNCKAFVTNSTGSILTNGISSVLSTFGELGWHSFTFATPATITKGANYKLAIVCDTTSATRLTFTGTGGSDEMCRDIDTQSYETPGNIMGTESPCWSPATQAGAKGGFRGKK